MMKCFALSAVVCAACTGALAHPHVFVDTQLSIVVDDAGVARSVEITWTYDAFYSLLIMEDMGLDQDGDGELTAEEEQQLNGFDLKWLPSFEGDLYALDGEAVVVLGRPTARGASVKEGLITTVHARALEAPAEGLQFKAYDPTFYTAYHLITAAAVEGPCATATTPVDLDAAYTLLEEMLYAIPAAQAEAQFPEVGEAFADTVTVSCAG